ncbi:MAG: site-specific integrase [Chitinophagales bacterium]
MKGNTFAISFVLKRNKAKDADNIPIYIRLIINKHRLEISTKMYINAIYWDSKKHLSKKSYSSHKELNEHLLVLKNKLYSCYTELIQTNKPITAQRIKNLYLGNSNVNIDTIVQVSTLHIQEMEKFLGKNTFYGNYKNYKTTHKYILEFMPLVYKKKDLPLDEINYSFIKQFEYFLQTEKNCKQNGTMKQMQRLKKVLNWAIKNEYLTENPFKNYTISFKRYDRGYLTLEEISNIENLTGLSKKLQYTKDFFVFQLYTGLAYSDMISLECNDIIKGIDNEYWIVKNRVKTDTKITVPLLPISLDILFRHVGDTTLSPGTKKVFPTISNQKINKNLKELGKLAKVKKQLSTHLARHSAATTIWLQNGISLEVVSKMLGHTKISTTQIYGRIVEEKIAEEMKGLRDRLK